jgi:hypothetical protein
MRAKGTGFCAKIHPVLGQKAVEETHRYAAVLGNGMFAQGAEQIWQRKACTSKGMKVRRQRALAKGDFEKTGTNLSATKKAPVSQRLFRMP